MRNWTDSPQGRIIEWNWTSGAPQAMGLVRLALFALFLLTDSIFGWGGIYGQCMGPVPIHIERKLSGHRFVAVYKVNNDWGICFADCISQLISLDDRSPLPKIKWTWGHHGLRPRPSMASWSLNYYYYCSYLMEKQRIWLRKSTLLDLTERNANLIIPSCCHLPISCRSLVDRCGSRGSCKPQI